MEVQALVDGGTDVNEAGAADRRPLHRAAGGGHVDICKYLVEKGAIIDQPDKFKRTALHWAAISGQKDCVDYLTDNGANLKAVTKTGETALHCSAEAGRVEVVRTLIEKMGDQKEELFKMENSDGKLACDLAIVKKHKAVVQTLKELGDPKAGSAACIIC